MFIVTTILAEEAFEMLTIKECTALVNGLSEQCASALLEGQVVNVGADVDCKYRILVSNVLCSNISA